MPKSPHDAPHNAPAASIRKFSPEVVAAVRLAMVSGVGPLLRQGLRERFGDAQTILSAPPSELRMVPKIGPKLASKIASAMNTVNVEQELQLVEHFGLQLIVEGSREYPRLLEELPDPPAVLFCRGKLLPADQLSVGIVGTRHASPYGLKHAENLAFGLAKAGFTIVSGLARGIDGAAHRGALKAGGRTIAVLGGGILKIYPHEHEPLANEIAESGVVLSEQPPRMQPLAGMFPQRNRIISGLSLGTIVVEAAGRSGALITARHAMEQGREVFAVPGRIDQRQSKGCHRLIRDGAKLVESIEDVLEELGPLVEAAPREDGTTIRHPAELKLNEIEQKVLQAIELEPTSIDKIADTTGMPVHRVLSTISVLEMRRLIRRVSGNSVLRL